MRLTISPKLAQIHDGLAGLSNLVLGDGHGVQSRLPFAVNSSKYHRRGGLNSLRRYMTASVSWREFQNVLEPRGVAGLGCNEWLSNSCKSSSLRPFPVPFPSQYHYFLIQLYQRLFRSHGYSSLELGHIAVTLFLTLAPIRGAERGSIDKQPCLQMTPNRPPFL